MNVPMTVPVILQAFASSLTVLSNLFIARHVLLHPSDPIPTVALVASASGSIFWILYSVMDKQYFLLVSSLTNFSLQFLSFVIRLRMLCASQRDWQERAPSMSSLNAISLAREVATLNSTLATSSSDSLPSLSPLH